jgi:predicted  nucleic acid-binding Zn-ribbon protein
LKKETMETVNETIGTDIDRLAALQAVDQRLKDRRDRMAILVSEAEGYEVELSRQREALVALTAERDGLEARRVEMDRQLDVLGGKIRDNRMRMNRVRNSTELLALQREIDLSKEANQQIEEELLRVMEVLEGLAAQIAAAQETLSRLEADATATVTARRSEGESLRQQVEAEGGQREALAAAMDPGLRSKYEQIFDRRNGTAVVAARDYMCTGCRMSIPPQLYNELQKHQHVVRQCPNCHRILFWRAAAET